MPQHATRTSWKKGQAGNPEKKVGPATLIKRTIAELFAVHEQTAINEIVKLATKSKSENMRYTASTYIIARVRGEIPKPVEVSGKDGGKIQVEDSTPAVMLLIASALNGVQEPSKPATPIIEAQVSDGPAD
jgi:hypothetical protein